MKLAKFFMLVAMLMLASNIANSLRAAPPDFARDVAPILAKYCSGCHNDDDRESNLSLQSFAEMQKGGERGPALVPGRADASLLIRAITGEVEPTMPPEGEPRPTEAEIDVLRGWIDSGAAGPEGAEPAFPEPAAPQIAPSENVHAYLTCQAASPDGKRLALGSYREVLLVDAASREVVTRTPQLIGKINSIAYSRDGSVFVAASGIAGLYGVATICRADDGTIVSQIKGHRDAIYDAKLSPEGKLLATCSYDRQVNLWEVASGKLMRSLTAHTGAVFDVAFSPGGKVLASASADGTVKIWRVDTGGRLDTLSQPEGEQFAVAINPAGDRIVAGGADRQLRMWRLVSSERAETNPLLLSRAGHDSSIVEIAFSPDGSKLISAAEGGDVIVWDAATLVPLKRLEKQPDVVTGVAFEPNGAACFIGRLDGTWQRYALEAEGAGQGGGSADSVARGSPDPAPDAATQASVAAATTESPRELSEQEPNNQIAQANEVSNSAVVRGVIAAPADGGEPDVDLYRFHARQGEKLVLEINAARDKSPLDSRLEVLAPDGKPIPRVVLQSVRKSYLTFRGLDSRQFNDFRLHGWQDMEINEYLYVGGEVVKLWLYPRGPDSGWLAYPGISGNRYTYFGTTGLSHALNETCYVVESHPPGETLIPNGLPEFTLYYENDDDGWRKWGADSRLTFTAQADGEYLVRVSDVRALGGDEFKYALTVRAPRPDFQIKLGAADLTINKGSGKEFSIEAERIDEFDGEIRVAVTGLPAGFHVSDPLVIEAGQRIAYGTITADADAPPLTPENAKLTKLTASAVVGGREIVKDAIDLGELKLAERPKILVQVTPASGTGELVIAPGETITATVRVERHEFDGEIKFGTEYAGRNLPHGVIVDNIGLSGLTLLAGETERTLFITAAKWVPETTRPFHLQAQVEGNQTSWPVTLHVKNRQAVAQAAPQGPATASAEQ